MVRVIKKGEKSEDEIRAAIEGADQDGFIVSKIVKEEGYIIIYFKFEEEL